MILWSGVLNEFLTYNVSIYNGFITYNPIISQGRCTQKRELEEV